MLRAWETGQVIFSSTGRRRGQKQLAEGGLSILAWGAACFSAVFRFNRSIGPIELGQFLFGKAPVGVGKLSVPAQEKMPQAVPQHYTPSGFDRVILAFSS